MLGCDCNKRNQPIYGIHFHIATGQVMMVTCKVIQHNPYKEKTMHLQHPKKEHLRTCKENGQSLDPN